MSELPEKAVEAMVDSPGAVESVLYEALASGHVQAFTRDELIVIWGGDTDSGLWREIAHKAQGYLDAMGEG